MSRKKRLTVPKKPRQQRFANRETHVGEFGSQLVR